MLAKHTAAELMGEPSFRCQSCKARLVLVRGSNDGAQQDRRSDPGLLAALDNKMIEESFIVLDDRKGPGECCAWATKCPYISSILEEPVQAVIGELCCVLGLTAILLLVAS